MIDSEIVLGLPCYQIISSQKRDGFEVHTVEYVGPSACIKCGSRQLRSKGLFERTIRHEDAGLRHCLLKVLARKWRCQNCFKQFRQPLPGILPYQRASEAFQEFIYRQHLDGVNRSSIRRRERES